MRLGLATRSGLAARSGLAIVSLFVTIVAGCQKQPATALQPLPIRQISRPRVVSATPFFLAGGVDRTIALLCGASLHRITAGNEAMTVVEQPAPDVRAAWFGPDALIDRWLVRTTDGAAVASRELAIPLPGWPNGIDIGPAVFATGGTALAAAPADGPDRDVRLWEFKPSRGQPGFLPERPLVIPLAEGRTARFLDLDITGKYLMVVDDGGRIAIYKTPDTKPAYEQTLDPATEGAIRTADLSPEGDWFVAAARTVRVRAWRLPFMSAPLSSFGDVEHVFFAGGVEALITVDENGLAIRWLLNYGDVKADATAQLDSVNVAVSPDAAGRALFSLTSDGRVRGWATADLVELEAMAAGVCGGE